MSRNLEFSIDEFYHLYNRGNDKRIIFNHEIDYQRFMVLLYLCNSDLKVDIGDSLKQGRTLSELYDLDKGENLVDIISYCLMPNHFHILVKEKIEGGISLFMQKLTTAYTMYFNKKYNRNGSLLQGKFKGRHVEDDSYLKYLFAYFGLNPVKLIDKNWKENKIKDLKKAENFLMNYQFSSFLDHFSESRKEVVILNKESSPEYFKSKREFMDFIDEWLNFDKVEPCHVAR